MIRMIITAVAGALVSTLFGYLLLPVLRALKAGQSVRDIGPTWHNSKAGTPLMMGLMFIGGSLDASLPTCTGSRSTAPSLSLPWLPASASSALLTTTTRSITAGIWD